MSRSCLLFFFAWLLVFPVQAQDSSSSPNRLKVLFLGDDGGHAPAERLRDAARPMMNRGIELYYTSNLGDITLERLQQYDALLLYANYHEPEYPETPTEFEDALIEYVEQGGGFVPVHSASGNFRDSQRFIDLLGGQFLSHGEGTFSTTIEEPRHEVMQGFDGFESWDESYVHQNHNTEHRTVLSYRGDEPYTWIRNQGDGRIFYTAWGHDERTWQNEGFHELLERGIRWAAGQDVQQQLDSRIIANPFEYVVLDVPYPPPHEARLEYEENEGTMDRGSNYPMYYQKQQPLSAEAAIDRMVVPSGFRVELFASEPDIVNPIAMNWDADGRLWVIESIEYPYPRDFWPDGGGKDRIVILEDTNNDGQADEFTLFADSLNIPTSLTFANGGVIVHQAPQTLFLKDTTGDDKADMREVLFEGWDQWDTHAGPNNLHYGLDNQIWGVLGYAGMDGEVGGVHHEFEMGVYRFRQDGSNLEFLRRTNNNTWGLGFNEEGVPFISTANGNPSTYLPFSQNLYDNLPGLDDSVTERLTNSARVITLTNLFRQVDWVGAFTSAAGHGVYTARTYPQEYWNQRAFVTEPTVQLIAEMDIEPRGSSFQAYYPRNLIASDDEWFSPIMAEVGPDGHVWIADWYNYILQHNAESDRQEPTPGNAYANPLRDREHGRIYRLVYEDAEAEEPLALKDAASEELVHTLAHSNMLWRKHAQRLLVERGQHDVIPELMELVTDQSADELGLNVGATHALWTLHGLDQLQDDTSESFQTAVQALAHPSAGVRRNAVQVLPDAGSSAEAILRHNLLQDEDLQVRLQAIVALAEMPESEEVGGELYHLLSQPQNMNDRWIREAAALASATHSPGFLHAAQSDGELARAQSLPEDTEPGTTLQSIVSLVMEANPEDAPRVASDPSEDESTTVDIVLEVGVIPNALEFDREELRVEAGQEVRLVFNNSGNMEHNLLLAQPGTLADVGQLADEMIASPTARENEFVPDTPYVWASTPILGPGEQYEIEFTAPEEAGEYPFVCTIPGHWRTMQGVLIVE